jgi:hypothetical protein
MSFRIKQTSPFIGVTETPKQQPETKLSYEDLSKSLKTPEGLNTLINSTPTTTVNKPSGSSDKGLAIRTDSLSKRDFY